MIIVWLYNENILKSQHMWFVPFLVLQFSMSGQKAQVFLFCFGHQLTQAMLDTWTRWIVRLCLYGSLMVKFTIQISSGFLLPSIHSKLFDKLYENKFLFLILFRTRRRTLNAYGVYYYTDAYCKQNAIQNLKQKRVYLVRLCGSPSRCCIRLLIKHVMKSGHFIKFNHSDQWT